MELSVVMPCLNEADTVGVCIQKAQQAMASHRIEGEVIIADNGSSDGSARIAEQLGARVVHVRDKGYGHALMGGIAAARGEYVLMGDADDSYDFLELPKFVERLRGGFDLVQGCRLPAGGGQLAEGSMPWSHRWIGNPIFSWLARHWFRAPIHDVYCGLRAFRRGHFLRLDLRCTGMEFAPEMIIKSSLYRAKIAEVPITLHRDGRKARGSHLRTLRDGWRTLRFLLIYSPRHLLLTPGIVLLLVGLAGYGVAMPGVSLWGVTFDAHTLLFSSLALICGYQSVLFALLTKIFAINEGLLPPDPKVEAFSRLVSVERGLLAGGLGMVFGLALLGLAVNQWRLAHFGRLDYAETMRLVIPGSTLTTLGFQSVLASFVRSLLYLSRR